MACVYCYRVGSQDCFKVGRTRNAPHKRKMGLSTGSPHVLELYREVPTDDAPSLEKYIHWLLDPKRAANGEFFNVSQQELDNAIEEARSFRNEALPALQEAKKLKRKRPTNRIVEPTGEHVLLHRALRDAERQRFLVEQRIAILQSKLQIAIGEDLAIRGIASWKWREQSILDQGLLRKEQPKSFFERYCKVSASRIFRLHEGRIKLKEET